MIEKLLNRMISRFQRKVECIRDVTWRIWRPPSLKGAMSFFLAKGSNFLGYQRNLKMRLESVGYGWYVLSQENGVVGVLLQTEGSRSDIRAIEGRLDVEKDGFQGSARNSALLRGGNEISESG
ncbi:uncharacterized protein LOC143453244 isoform X3 [Clavelina lepadiformis]|uniref:uncharacterized protein LOC143451443 isoform X3 n=1 Tax=Clavelina lepadiformis TaxID=159417 RepID=UPI004042B735